MAKQGSTISGLMDAFATVVSLALQHGVPLSVLCEKLSHMRFEPSGWSGNPKIGYAKSLMDYIARWLELRFLTGDQGELFKAIPMPAQPAMDANGTDPVGALGELIQMGDAPACNICGSLMVRPTYFAVLDRWVCGHLCSFSFLSISTPFLLSGFSSIDLA
jgi:ribonucleoside-diphosphate reductase alpha chain